MRALTAGGRESGNLAAYLERLLIRFAHLATGAEIEFARPDSGLAKGRDVLWLSDAHIPTAEHKTFEAYCRERWGFTKSRANQLIAGADVAATMVANELPAPNERQARELAKLPPEKQPEAWSEKAARCSTAAREYRESSECDSGRSYFSHARA